MDFKVKKTSSVPNSLGRTAPNGQIGRTKDFELQEAVPKQVIKQNTSSGSSQGETTGIPRRLSQLFLPPVLASNEDSFTKEEEGDDSNESTRLLENPEKAGVIVPPKTTSVPTKVVKGPPISASVAPQAGIDPIKEKKKLENVKSDATDVSLSVLDEIESEKVDSDFDESDHPSRGSTQGSESSGDDSDDHSPDRDHDYTSWDDTICSNRSSYFKHYYQKNLASLSSPRGNDVGTSHNSLVSLIKEKSKMADEKSAEEKKKKKREDIGLLGLVIFLFLVLVIGISLIYHFYNLHLAELSLFKRLKFYEETRLLNLLDSQGNIDIQAKLGSNLSLYSKPEDCTLYLQYFYKKTGEDEQAYVNGLAVLNAANKTSSELFTVPKYREYEFQFDDETVCLDWANQARVQIHKAATHEEVNCYNVFWSAHAAGMPLQDCMMMGRSGEVWWGIGEISGGGYPLESISDLEAELCFTGELGKHPFGKILRRTFLSSFGGLLILPNHLPARVSINSREVCISVNPYDSMNPRLPLTLNYTLCSSPNISSTMDYLYYLARGGKYFQPLSTKHEDIIRTRILQRIEQPVWIPGKQTTGSKVTQEKILRHVDTIIRSELSKQNQTERGHILLPLSWQRKAGDMTFDPTRFPDPKTLIKTLSEKGFRLALTISPLVSTDTKAFKNGTMEGFWVQQKGSPLPALIQHKGVVAGVLTDFTNARAAKWFSSKLKWIKNEYEIDRFHLQVPDSHLIPRYHEFHHSLTNPDLALQWFLKSVSSVSLPVSTDAVISPPRMPIFVTIGNGESGWKSLSSLVPRILTLSMLGYPLVDAGVVGGRRNWTGNVPNPKLYVRWFQAVSFLPAFQMNVLPKEYDESVRDIIKDCIKLRETLVLPRLKVAIEGSLTNNTPLIYPLGLLYPHDEVAAGVGDEWILGDDLLVAPVLTEDQTSRDIYIPEGLWESMLDGKVKTGPGWIHKYEVPLSKVAHFLKKDTI